MAGIADRRPRHHDDLAAAPGRGAAPGHGVPGKTTLVDRAQAGVAPTQPLPAALRATLEASLGTDLSAIRVGEDPSVAALGARAHARGIEVLFGPGMYQPDTADGQALIAHEVVHLVQQASGPIATTGKVAGTPVNADPSLERQADDLGARALRGEKLAASSPAPRPSAGPVQGFFEDVSKMFLDPLVDAATDLWDALTDHDAGAKGKGKGKAPDPVAPDKPAPAKLGDDEWQDVMEDARADVQVTENYAVTTRSLNPDLLFMIRVAPVPSRDEFYDLLSDKHERTKGKDGSQLTPGRLAYRLGEALTERAAAGAELPVQLAGKLALIDRAAHDGAHDGAPDGAIDISKNAGGALRKKLGKGLSKSGCAAIDGWIKGHYRGSRLTLNPVEVLELRSVVTSAVTASAVDPARDAKIEQLRADLAACEVRVRAVLRARASETTHEAKRALWTRLADTADTAGVFVDRTLTSYTIEAEDGTTTTLDPAIALSVNFLNPGGFKNGGGKYSDATADSVLAEVYAGDPAQAAKSAATKKFLHTLNANEGGPASMNTWDGEIVTAGPGLSGSGRLQKSMFAFKAADPGGFFDALGKFGIDIVRAGKGNPYFTVRVPRDVNAIPPAMRASVTPGAMIIGSSTTGAKKSSDAYQECAALRYISKDPVLMSRLMYAGQHNYQRFLIAEAAKSMQAAEEFSFLVRPDAGEPWRASWHAIIDPLGADWLAATQAVIAYRYHASAAIYDDLKVSAAGFYRATFGATRTPDQLTTDERKQIGRHVAGQLKPGKYKVYRAQFPSVAADVFPAAKGGKGDKDDDAGGDDAGGDDDGADGADDSASEGA